MILDDVVYVDSREPLKIQKMAEKFFDQIEVKFLPVGDFVYKDICIERKQVEDFAGSIRPKKGKKEGRVFVQARNMFRNFRQHYVIIVGSHKDLTQKFRQNKKGYVTVDQYIGAKASLHQITKVDTVENNTQFFKTAKSLFKKGTDGKDRTQGRAERVKLTTGNIELDMLSCIPNLGEVRANAVLAEYDLYDLYYVTEKDLLSINGIGPKFAKLIKQTYRIKETPI
jgi:ERCC4-type nuclease